jgi:hypothetical protein
MELWRQGKQFVKTWVPGAAPVFRGSRRFLESLTSRARRLHRRFESTKARFARIHRENGWRDKDSVSGPGSNLASTARLRQLLPQLLTEFGVTTLLDAPCGDFHWMHETELPGVEYFGADIVKPLIARNQGRYQGPRRHFICLNLIKDRLPRVDLILCRDCLVHFSLRDIARTLANFKRSGATYLLTTTFTDRESTGDIPTGKWRPINLQGPPFYFPQPLRILNEECPEKQGLYRDKSLALWRLDQIPIPRTAALWEA